MSDSGARCTLHPDAAAADTCARCGRFACQRCLGARAICGACIVVLHAESPTAALARALRWLVWFSLFTSAVELLLGPNPVKTVSLMRVFVWMLDFLAATACVITFIRWEFRALTLASRVRPASGLRPRRAVTAWFVPFINLWVPRADLLSLVDTFDGNVARWSVHVWFVSWLGVAITIGASVMPRSLVAPSEALTLISTIAWTIAGLALLRVVTTVERAMKASSA